MKYFLDTNIMSYLLNRRSEYHQSVREAIKKVSQNDLFLSVVTACELEAGLYCIKSNQEDYKKRMSALLEQVLEKFNIAEFPCQAAKYYGQIRGGLIKQGKDIGMADSMIAAHVIFENASLITHNQKHFKRINEYNLGKLDLVEWIKS